MQDLPSKTVMQASDPMRDRSHGGAPFLVTAEGAGVGARFLTGEVAAVDGIGESRRDDQEDGHQESESFHARNKPG